MKILYTFELAHIGWECDTSGSVIEDDYGNRQIVLTNHGMEYCAEPSELVQQIEMYLQLASDTTAALAIYRNEEGSDALHNVE